MTITQEYTDGTLVITNLDPASIAGIASSIKKNGEETEYKHEIFVVGGGKTVLQSDTEKDHCDFLNAVKNERREFITLTWKLENGDSFGITAGPYSVTMNSVEFNKSADGSSGKFRVTFEYSGTAEFEFPHIKDINDTDTQIFHSLSQHTQQKLMRKF